MAPANTNQMERPDPEATQQSPNATSEETTHSPVDDDGQNARKAPDSDPGDEIVAPVNSSWQKGPLPPQDKEKATQVLAACRDRDLEALADLATSQGGLIEDELRRTAWPILLGCQQEQSPEIDWTKLERHRDEEQVELDVNRSFVYYPENESKQRLEHRKSELSDLITLVLRQHPILCYFQGYHDIVQVLLLVLGADAAFPAVARLSLLRIRDFMLPTLSAAEAHLRLLPAILYAADRDLYQHLSGATQPTPFFALAATLTLYAHDIEEYGDIARLFDYLLASEAAVPVYLFAVIVMSRKKELLEIDHSEPEMLHSILSKLPKPLDLEALISRTHTLFQQHPPQKLPYRAWPRISHYSVLKTTRDPHALATQTLADGEALFQKQAAQIRRQDAVKRVRERIQLLGYRYRRSARWTGAAVLVAVLAVYFGRANGAAGFGEWISLVGNVRLKAGELVQQVFSRWG